MVSIPEQPIMPPDPRQPQDPSPLAPAPVAKKKKKAPAKKKPKSALQKWLDKDTTYQTQVAALNKALADYQANTVQNSALYNADWGQQLKNAKDANKRTVEDTTNSYAGRGVLFSGLYGKAQSDVANVFAGTQTDLNNTRLNFQTGQRQNYTNFLSQQDLNKLQAKQDAIARRAAKAGTI